MFRKRSCRFQSYFKTQFQELALYVDDKVSGYSAEIEKRLRYVMHCFVPTSCAVSLDGSFDQFIMMQGTILAGYSTVEPPWAVPMLIIG